MVVIDRVFKCEIDPAVGGNELTTLSYLTVGFDKLYRNVLAMEKPLRERDEAANRITMSFGNVPGMPQEAVALLPCLFHWYGTSLINYSRLVGFLSALSSGAFTRRDLEDTSKFKTVTEACDDYVSSVPELAAVKVWRDKVAGHFAITAPRKTKQTFDNPAFLDFSVMYPVAFDEGRFRVGTLRLLRSDAAGNAHTGELPRWSLTELHEALGARYWGAL